MDATVDKPLTFTILSCACGWHSKEMTRAELHELGVPYYCGECNSQRIAWLTFEPEERVQAYRAFGLPAEEQVEALANVASERQRKAVEGFITQHFPQAPEPVLDDLCFLLASEFREGINLALETYGLKDGDPPA